MENQSRIVSKMLISICLSIMSLAGCSRQDDPKPSPPPNRVWPIPIHQDTPENYYRKFIFSESGSCESGNQSFHFLSTVPARVGVTSQGQDIIAEIYIMMDANNTYRAYYQEVDVIEYLEDGYTYEQANNVRLFNGNWSVDQGVVYLQGFGSLNGPVSYRDAVMELSVDAGQVNSHQHAIKTPVYFSQSTWAPFADLFPCQ